MTIKDASEVKIGDTVKPKNDNYIFVVESIEIRYNVAHSQKYYFFIGKAIKHGGIRVGYDHKQLKGVIHNEI